MSINTLRQRPTAVAKSIAAGHPRQAEEHMHEPEEHMHEHVSAVVDFIHQDMGRIGDSHIEWH